MTRAEMLSQLAWIKSATAGTSEIEHALIYGLADVVETLVREGAVPA